MALISSYAAIQDRCIRLPPTILLASPIHLTFTVSRGNIPTCSIIPAHEPILKALRVILVDMIIMQLILKY
jgi:hypothetical protein